MSQSRQLFPSKLGNGSTGPTGPSGTTDILDTNNTWRGTNQFNASLNSRFASFLGTQTPPSSFLAGQGICVGWNTATGFLGETDFVNIRGDGDGGFYFYNIARNGTLTSPLFIIDSSGVIGPQGITPTYTTLPTFTSAQIGGIITQAIDTTAIRTSTSTITFDPSIVSTITLPIGVWIITFNLICTLNTSASGVVLNLAIGPSVATIYGQTSSYGLPAWDVSSTLTVTQRITESTIINAYAEGKTFNAGVIATPKSLGSFFQAVRIA